MCPTLWVHFSTCPLTLPVKQMGPSAYDAYAVAVGCIFLEECFAYAGGGSNDNNGLLFHFVVFIFLRNCYYYLAAQKDTV